MLVAGAIGVRIISFFASRRQKLVTFNLRAC